MWRLMSKFNLYDVLAMMAIGCILLYDIQLSGCNKVESLSGNLSLMGGLILLALSYGLGIINHQLTDFLTSKLRWGLNVWLVKRYITNPIHQLKPFLHEHTKKLLEAKGMDENEMMGKYYEAYNYAIIYNPQTVVLTLEKQLVLLRNLAIPMIWLACASIEDRCCKIAVVVGVLVVLLITTLLRTMKQVDLVWEEYEAVRQLELEKK